MAVFCEGEGFGISHMLATSANTCLHIVKHPQALCLLAWFQSLEVKLLTLAGRPQTWKNMFQCFLLLLLISLLVWWLRDVGGLCCDLITCHCLFKQDQSLWVTVFTCLPFSVSIVLWVLWVLHLLCRCMGCDVHGFVCTGSDTFPKRKKEDKTSYNAASMGVMRRCWLEGGLDWGTFYMSSGPWAAGD